MSKYICLILTVLYCERISAQLNENFSDGDFTINPVWSGDVDSFQVTGGQLKSKGSGQGAGKASLVTTNTLAGDMEWNFWMRLSFNPSSSNFARFYLVSDQPDLKGSLNGYYLQMGGSTGTTDSISLYRQSGNSRLRIIAGRSGTMGKTTNIVKVKVIRSAAAGWTLYTDTTAAGQYFAEGSAYDSLHKASSYIGLFIQYTQSNAQNFYLDDVYHGPVIIDTVPPSVISVSMLSSNLLEVKFSELLDEANAQDASKYNVNNGHGNPVSALINASDHARIQLEFAASFISGQQNKLVSNGLRDLSGNTRASDSISFTWFQPLPHDIVINEFMADPDPEIGLPAEEFVELFNKTAYEIDLEGWTLSDGSGTFSIPSCSIPPTGFIILCSASKQSLFQSFGNTAGLGSFPSLNNSGDQLILRNGSGVIIDQLSYSDTWYKDALKKNGGWSLELIIPIHPCSGRDNWIASTHPAGGTPGISNSVFSSQADTAAPKWLNIFVIDSTLLLLTFDEGIDSLSVINADYTIAGGSGILSKTLSASKDTLLLLLSQPLNSGQTYLLTLGGLKDCWGNSMPAEIRSIVFLRPVEAKAFDILINEIFPDPDPIVGLPVVEFIELYNRTSSPVSLEGWTISDGGTPAVLTPIIIAGDSMLIICPANSFQAYSAYGRTAGIPSFPSLNQEGDRLVLSNSYGNIIHQVNYNQSWYKDALKEEGGWTLEMIDAGNPCAGKNNWKASTNPSGGTPGKMNSIAGKNADRNGPKLLRAYIQGNRELVLAFDEALDSLSISSALNYHIEPAFGPAVDFQMWDADKMDVKLSFNDSFSLGVEYSASVSNLRDCAGNQSETDPLHVVRFGIPQPPAIGDLVINEVLFDPRQAGVDFVEIYNRSSKIIDLKDILLANTDDQDQLKDIEKISSVPWLLFPTQYMALSTSPDNLKKEYPAAMKENCFQMDGFPSYNDEEGRVVLLGTNGLRYEQFNYSDKMHFALIDDAEGVSLERIDFTRPVSDITNWHSAASDVNFATPGYRNSQYLHSAAGDAAFTLEYETFSPDLDGYRDVLNIGYRFTEPGFVLNAIIFDASGRQVRRLLNNELLGTEGVYSWDGITDKNEKALIGIYVIYLEIFNLKGEVKAHKKTCVLAGKF